MTEDDSRQKDSLRIFVLCVTICVIFCLSLSLLLSSVYRLLLLFCCFGPCSVLRAFRAAASAPGRYSATMSYLPSVELKTFSGSSTPSAPWAPSLSPPGQYWGTILQIKLLAIKCSWTCWNMLEHVKNGFKTCQTDLKYFEMFETIVANSASSDVCQGCGLCSTALLRWSFGIRWEWPK